jgi:hypothetical protein
LQLYGPFIKKGETTEISNYRPVSLLITLSKVIEIVVFKRLDQHLESDNIVAIEQFGIGKGLSIESADFTITDNILLTKSVTYSVT